MFELKLSNMELLAVESGGTIEYGCNQEWFDTPWKRGAGCGPSVVSTILGYIEQKRRTREQWLELMNDVWEDVTPTFQGLPSTALLVERIHKYLARRGLDYAVTALDIPGRNDPRARFDVVRDYIAGALSLDVPVALLTLDTGTVKTLDDWHWTIISRLSYDDLTATVLNYNCGHVFEVDIREWHETTVKGGGAVSVIPRQGAARSG